MCAQKCHVGINIPISKACVHDCRYSDTWIVKISIEFGNARAVFRRFIGNLVSKVFFTDM
jgi:hypothetical protein